MKKPGDCLSARLVVCSGFASSRLHLRLGRRPEIKAVPKEKVKGAKETIQIHGRY
jgi:hypothetical protein